MIFDHFKKRSSASVGKRGEDLATTYLKKHQYKILDRNYRNRHGVQVGEIDIIAQKKNVLIFVEVKTRSVSLSTLESILPQEQITAAKLRRLQKAAAAYLHQKDLCNVPHRFDAITVKLFKEQKRLPVISHIKSVFL